MSTRKSFVIASAIGAILVIATVAAIVLHTLSSLELSCEVCVQFQGRTACREAYGVTREEATRTAIDNACAQLASGMAESVACTTRTEPTSIQCAGD